MFSTIRFVLLLVLSTAFFIFGCSEDSENNPVSGGDMTSNIRVIHTSYNAPAVDIKVNGTTAIPDLGYGASSGYAGLNAGSYNITVTPAGESAPIVIDADVVLEENKEYTVIAAGDLNNIEAVIVEPCESNSKPNMPNRGALRPATTTCWP